MTPDLAALWAALPQIANVRASGDGRWAFWTWSGLSETEDVWCAPTDGSAPPVRLTAGSDHFLIRDVSQDGGRLVLAQSRNASERDRLILLDRAAGGRLTELTPAQDSHYVYGGVLSPDAAAVYFVANFDYATGRVTEGGQVWRQDIATGARTCLARCDAPFGQGVTLSPDGRRLLWPRNLRAPGGTQLWVMDTDGANLRKVLDLGPSNAVTGDWIDDRRIAFVADDGARDVLGTVDADTGAVTLLAGEPGLRPLAVVPGAGGAFACIAHDRAWTRPVTVSAAGAIRPLPNRSGRRSLLPHAGLPDGGWLAEAYDADAPHVLLRVMPDGSCLTLAAPAPEPGRRHTRPADFTWVSPDGETVQGFLYRPRGVPKGLIAYVHGGPTWHSEDWVNPRVQFWVQSGYAVLDPNYRGSTGFGRRWREKVKEDGWGGREQADIRAGIEAALAAGLPGPVAVAGNSYGGFSAWYQITRAPDLVTAAIPMCGMYRLDIDYAETGMPWGRSYSEEMMGGPPEALPDKYANASPGAFIDSVRGHVLVVHGLADTNVGPENTHAAIREMTALGIPHEALLFADEGHGIFRRGNVETYLRATGDFLARAFAEGMR
ncbi:MAG: prolyl oligopeptidase family serine peptidase [Rhodobacteraceae bacterium]|nr:prolyl oligopeptidase family serine peptidase [Paracoccaceae bacterium]